MNDDELTRYSRHLLLPEIDYAGQEKLKNATVLIVGLGGLGSPVSMYLAAAGVGTLLLNDFDVVDLGNLQRQILYGTPDVGSAKTEVARDALRRINPHVQIETYNEKLEAETLYQLAARADVVVDASDNFATRYAVNRATLRARKPLISGAAIRFAGQITVFSSTDPASPCYCCLFRENNETDDAGETCAQRGVFSPVVGIVASVQAAETLKLLMNIGKPLVGHLWRIDARDMSQRTSRLFRDPECPACAPAANLTRQAGEISR